MSREMFLKKFLSIFQLFFPLLKQYTILSYYNFLVEKLKKRSKMFLNKFNVILEYDVQILKGYSR